MSRTAILIALVTALAPVPAFAQDARYAALQAADEARDALRFLAEDARFLADGAIAVGDSDGWQRYTNFGTRAGNVAYDYDGYVRDLENVNLPLRLVEQSYAFNRQGARDLQLAFARLRGAPEYFVERFRLYEENDRVFAGLIVTPPDDPDAEPDVPGRWECTVQWSMNGTWMRFRGQGDSRNRAKAEALRQCNQTAGRFCTLQGCVRLDGLRR